MTGTIVNTACIILGSCLGSILKKGVRPQYKTALYNAIGVCSLLLGANAFCRAMPQSGFPVLFIVSVAAGSLAGYRLDLDGRFNRLVDSRRKSKDGGEGRLGEGLSTGILLYCIGTFSMLGPVLSALQGDNTFLYTNATLDLITSTVLASTYGIGMIWAAPVLFCWQGMFYAIAKISEAAISEALVGELSIVGGILIAASGLGILGIKDCKPLNMIPSLLVPPLFFLLRPIWGVVF